MRILPISSSRKPAFVLAFAATLSSMICGQLVADDKPKPQVVTGTERVELFRLAIGVTHVLELEKQMKAKFPNCGSELLFDFASELEDVKESESNLTFGQCIGLVLPNLETYVGIALPVEASDLFKSEDYELGEDADGNKTIDGQQVLETDRYFSYVDGLDEVQLLNSKQIGQQLIDFAIKSEERLVQIEVSPATIGRSMVRDQLLGYRATLDTAAQRHDDESDLDYSFRSLTAGHQGKLVELLFRDVEKVSFRASSSDPAYPFVFEWSVDCRKQSELLSYFQEMKQRRNRSLSWLHPSANAFGTVSMALPSKIQQQLVVAGQATARSVQEDAGLGGQAAAQSESIFRGIAESGAFEMLLQQVPFHEESDCYVGIVPLGSVGVFDSELIQLVSDQDSLTTLTEIDGWPVYSIDGWLGLELGDGWVPCLVATDSMLCLMAFKEAEQEKGLELAAEFVRREFSPSRQGSRYANAIMAAEFSVSDLVNFLDGDGGDLQSLLPVDVDAATGSKHVQLDQDSALWSVSLDGQSIVAQCRFEPNALALGLACCEGFINFLVEVSEL